MLERLKASARSFRSRRAPVPSGAGESEAARREAVVKRARFASHGAIVFFVLIHLAVFVHAEMAPCSAVDPAPWQPPCRFGLQYRYFNPSLRAPFFDYEGAVLFRDLLVSSALFLAVHLLMLNSNPGYVEGLRERPSHSEGVDGTLVAAVALEGRGDRDFHPVTGEHWCAVCQHWQPLRSRHCADCGKCVRRFDHHCFWVGTCVGQNNHRWFLALLAYDTWHISFALRVTISAFDTQIGTWWTAFAFALTGFGCIMLLLVVGLLLFHAYLAAVGSTTWELVSARHISYLSRRPGRFNRGLFANLASFVRPPPSWGTDHDAAAV